MGTYSCRRIDSRVKRASSSGVRISMLCTLNKRKLMAWRHVAILVFMGGFDYECGFLLKETIFSSCGSSTTEMDE